MRSLDKFKVTTQDAYNYAASKFFSDQQLCIVIRLNGKVDEIALSKAVRLTLDLEPVLGCRLVENAGNLFWERRSDLDKIELCSIVEMDSSDKEIEAWINKAIYADIDPLVALKVFRKKDKDTICIKVNHAVCDAGGLKEYALLISDFYSMLVTCGRRSIKPNFGRRDQSQIFEHIKNPKSIPIKGFPKPTWTLPLKTGNERFHAFRNVSQVQFTAIKSYASNKKATINDILLTALYRTFFALNGTPMSKPMIIQVSIDLRRYLPKQKTEAICNLSGALHVALERKKAESFSDTLERIKASMDKLKENYPGLDSVSGLEYLFSQGYIRMEKYLAESAIMSKKYNVTFPLLSNFGILEEYQFGKLSMIKGFITSPIMYQPGFMLGASTFNGEMTFSIGYCGQENAKQVNSFLNAFFKELPKCNQISA